MAGLERPRSLSPGVYKRRRYVQVEGKTEDTQNTHKGAGRDCIDLTPSSHAEPTEVLARRRRRTREGEGEIASEDTKIKRSCSLKLDVQEQGRKAMEAKLSFPTGENHD
jgi:hypothetical protein